MPDALALLIKDHDRIKELFDDFCAAAEAESRRRLAEEAMRELLSHARMEEQLFYPALYVRGERESIDKAVEEHGVVDRLIQELERMRPSDDRYRAKFQVLVEAARRHMEREEAETFAKAREAGLDLEALGAELARFKEKLFQQRRRLPSPAKRGRAGAGARRRAAARAAKAGKRF